MRLAKYGIREIFFSTVVLLGLAALCAVFVPRAGIYVALVPVVVWLWVLAFFRNPKRTVPDGEDTIVAPADGRLAEVTQLRNCEELGEPAIRVGIILSIFDVHLNRAPVAATVTEQTYTPGKFHNAFHDVSSSENENNLVKFAHGPRGLPFAVKQIAGLVARRIVSELKEGDRVDRGQIFGMIKFGSRTELFIPKRAGCTVLVKPGDVIRAGSTVVARLGPADDDGGE